MEAHLKQLLLDLRERLSEALAESPEVGETLDELRKSGYAVQLLMDCKRDPQQGDAAEEVSVPALPPAPPPGDFRMNAQDLSFLRSVGIDPTRTTRGLRQRPLRTRRASAERDVTGGTSGDQEGPSLSTRREGS